MPQQTEEFFAYLLKSAEEAEGEEEKEKYLVLHKVRELDILKTCILHDPASAEVPIAALLATLPEWGH